MSQRINFAEQSPELTRKLFEFSQVMKGSIGDSLLDLINIRASQLNGCAFCLDMHNKEAKIHGEQELRLYHVAIWWESPLFSDKERAALEWTEAVTKLPKRGIPDEVFERVRKQFTEQQILELTLAIGMINMWNRLNISFQTVPGSFDDMMGLGKAGLSYTPRSANA